MLSEKREKIAPWLPHERNYCPSPSFMLFFRRLLFASNATARGNLLFRAVELSNVYYGVCADYLCLSELRARKHNELKNSKI
jgi:hypothetical protein